MNDKRLIEKNYLSCLYTIYITIYCNNSEDNYLYLYENF